MEKQQSYIEVFNANYYGKSKEAKELEPLLKETYKGDSYIPWAVLERMMRQQDPESEIIKSYSSETGYIKLSKYALESEDVDGDRVVSSTNWSLSPMVQVKVTFMGHSVAEVFPVQDKSYAAPKYVDQNLVNKALQRAATRAIARITGLGLSLYEGKDLQFEDEESTPKPKPKNVKETKQKVKVTKPKATKTKEVQNEKITDVTHYYIDSQGKPVSYTAKEVAKLDVGVLVNLKEINKEEYEALNDKAPSGHLQLESSNVLNVLKLIRNNDEAVVNKILAKYNKVFIKSYKKAISLEQTDEEILDVLKLVKDSDKFEKTFTKLIVQEGGKA